MEKSISKELSLGIERHIDDLGRIVIPKEMRNKLNFEQNEVVSIKLFDDHIEIAKSKSKCLYIVNLFSSISLLLFVSFLIKYVPNTVIIAVTMLIIYKSYLS